MTHSTPTTAHDLHEQPSGGMPLVIACAANQAYALPLAVMLRSAIGHLAGEVRAEIYVVADGLDIETRDRVRASVPAEVTLSWVERGTEEFQDLPRWGRMALSTYHKLTLGSWLPRNVHRAIWLDCDILVQGDLLSLWSLPLNDQVVLACTDREVPLASAPFGVAGHQDLGISGDTPYFNAGVMLVDVVRWRDTEVERRCLEYLRRYGPRVWFWDQEALNAVLAGRWGRLDPRWNSPPALGARTVQDDLASAPWILHFAGNLKPWRLAGTGAWDTAYHRWLDQTAWAGFRPPTTWSSLLLAAYARSGVRRLFHPLERLHLRWVRWSTQRQD